MPKKGEISPNRKRQEQYEMMGQGLTYKVFADRWRKRIMREEKKRKKVISKCLGSDFNTIGVDYGKDQVDAMSYAIKMLSNRKGYSFPEVKMTEVTPPIEPTVPEKKKFLTPFLFDFVLLVIFVFVGQRLSASLLVEYIYPEPTTNTVIVKVKEKVVYKSPVKKVKKPITCTK